jgi:hypothetical protein
VSQGKHYVGLDPRPTHICADLEEKVRWLRERPADAAAVAQHGRALALRHLTRGAVLHDLASLLLGYHALAADTAPATGAVDNAAVWAHLRRQFPQNAYLREAVNAARKVVVEENEERTRPHHSRRRQVQLYNGFGDNNFKFFR